VRETVEGLIWKIGNNNSVNIWGDEWVPLPYMCKVFSPCVIGGGESKRAHQPRDPMVGD
jgi:hypothetical protein